MLCHYLFNKTAHVIFKYRFINDINITTKPARVGLQNLHAAVHPISTITDDAIWNVKSIIIILTKKNRRH